MSGHDVSRALKLRYDPEGDYLEVLLDQERTGYFRTTADERVMAKVGEADGAPVLLGFSILGVKSSGGRPIEVLLP